MLLSNVLGLEGYNLSFWRIYMLGPLLGGILAGLFSLLHAYLLENYAGARTHDDEEAEKNALGME